MKNDKNKKKEVEEELEDEVEDSKKHIAAGTEQGDEFEELKLQAEEWESKYKRALADYQNLQKRVSEEKNEWIRATNKGLLLRLLPVLDTLILAEAHIKDEGLTVSINHFLDILKAEGVTRIKTVGEEFNPHLMECMATDQGAENKVLEELRAGYMLYDKVLRAAQVKVGSAKQN